jgi:hypothetical protein
LERKLNGEIDGPAGKKHRLDDTDYLEQSREIVENVKSAVVAGTFLTTCFGDITASMCAGLLKKKKKAKISHTPESLANKTSPCLESEKIHKPHKAGNAENKEDTENGENGENTEKTKNTENTENMEKTENIDNAESAEEQLG